MLEATLVVREPNAAIPDEFKKLLLEKHTTAFGFAVPNKTHIENAVLWGGDVDLADSLNKCEETYKKDRIYYYFLETDTGDAGDVSVFESVQPFNLLVDDEKRALMSIIAVGDYPSFADRNQDGETYSDAYHMVNGSLKAVVDELWDFSNADVKTLVGFFEKPQQKAKVEALLGDAATIIFIPHTGTAKAITNAKKENNGQWPWGFSTNNLGFKQGDASPSSAASNGKTLTMAEKAALKRQQKEQGNTAEHPPGGSTITPEEHFAPLLTKESHLARFILTKGKLLVRPPKGSNASDARKWWLQNSKMPIPDKGNDYAKNLFQGFAADELKPNAPLFDLVARYMGEGVKQAASEQGPEQPAIPGDTDKGKKVPPAEFTLLISQDNKKRYLDLQKLGKIKSNTEDELKAQLQKYPLFSVAVGDQLNDILLWTAESHHELPSHMKDVLFHELRCRLLGLDVPDVEPEEKPEDKKPGEEKTLTMAEKAALKKQNKAA